MRVSLLMLFLIYLSQGIFCQQTVFEKDIRLKSGFNIKRESLPIENKSKNEVVLFLLDRNEINSLVLNKDYQLIDSFTTMRPAGAFTDLLGYSADSVGYHLVFTNDSKDEFMIKSILISERQIRMTTLPLGLKEEKFLESFQYKGKFYLLTIKKNSSFVRIYVIDGKVITRTGSIDFGDYKFSNKGYTKLYDVLLEEDGSPYIMKPRLYYVENNHPNSLALTTKENKMYCENDTVFITVDNNVENTKLISIDLNNFSSHIKLINQPTITCTDKVKSNSYLLHHVLFQIKGCKGELNLAVKNVLADSLISVFHANQNEEITFKNSPLIQEGGLTLLVQDTEEELSTTKLALRKIAGSDIGLTVYPAEENIALTLGGYVEVHRNTGGGFASPVPTTTVTTSYGGVITFKTVNQYNPVMYSYHQYTNSRSVYFKSLLNAYDFNHVEGVAGDNVFDKIRKFTDPIKEDIVSETIFKVDDYYVFGYYSKSEKKYFLRKFIE